MTQDLTHVLNCLNAFSCSAIGVGLPTARQAIPIICSDNAFGRLVGQKQPRVLPDILIGGPYMA